MRRIWWVRIICLGGGDASSGPQQRRSRDIASATGMALGARSRISAAMQMSRSVIIAIAWPVTVDHGQRAAIAVPHQPCGHRGRVRGAHAGHLSGHEPVHVHPDLLACKTKARTIAPAGSGATTREGMAMSGTRADVGFGLRSVASALWRRRPCGRAAAGGSGASRDRARGSAAMSTCDITTDIKTKLENKRTLGHSEVDDLDQERRRHAGGHGRLAVRAILEATLARSRRRVCASTTCSGSTSRRRKRRPRTSSKLTAALSALAVEQGALAGDAPAITGERAVAGDDAVTRDRDRDRVCRDRPRHRAHRAGRADARATSP